MKILLLSVVFSVVGFAQTGHEVKEVVLKDYQEQTVIKLNEETVRCSYIGYGFAELKISVPALEWLAFFDHSNIGETEPCMSAGICKGIGGDHLPEDILDSSRPEEQISIHFKLKEVFVINHDQKSCSRSIREELFSEVRGVEFDHVREKGIGSVEYEACLRL